MIAIRNLSKRFGKKVVLDGLELTVPKGQNTVVIGGSGTGKSVLLRRIAWDAAQSTTTTAGIAPRYWPIPWEMSSVSSNAE